MTSTRNTTYWITIVSALLVSTSGCGKPTAREEALRPSQVHDFSALFGQNCAGCHGSDGKLGPAPPLNDSLFLAIASADDIRQAITAGRHGTMMPAFAREQGGALTPLQVDVLIEGMRTRWAKPVANADKLPTYLAGPTPADDAAAIATGEQLFSTHCGDCHGPRGDGGPGGALRVPAFLALVSDLALRRLIVTGRPDLGMPDYRNRIPTGPNAKALTSAEIDQLVALLAAWRGEAHLPQPAEQATR